MKCIFVVIMCSPGKLDVIGFKTMLENFIILTAVVFIRMSCVDSNRPCMILTAHTVGLSDLYAENGTGARCELKTQNSEMSC